MKLEKNCKNPEKYFEIELKFGELSVFSKRIAFFVDINFLDYENIELFNQLIYTISNLISIINLQRSFYCVS